MKSLIFLPMLLLVGCATISDGSSQSVLVAASNAIEATQCNLTNEEGKWQAIANNAVTIHKDGNPIVVNCVNSKQSGSRTVSPEFQTKYLLIDFILLDACIISCIVDGVTNSFYKYPYNINVTMQQNNVK